MTCHGVIPDTFIACGEEGLYCSDECLLRAECERLRADWRVQFEARRRVEDMLLVAARERDAAERQRNEALQLMKDQTARAQRAERRASVFHTTEQIHRKAVQSLEAECERLRKVLEVLCVDRDVPAWVQDYAAASLEQRTNPQ